MMRFGRLLRTSGGVSAQAGAGSLPGSGSLLLARTDLGLQVFTSSADEMFGLRVAAGVGGRCEPVGGWPVLDCGEVYQLRVAGGFVDDGPGRVDAQVVADMVAGLLPEGGWVGAGVRLLRPRETGWLGLWRVWSLRRRGLVPPAGGRGAEVGVSLVAGGPGGVGGVLGQVVSVLGLPVETRERRVRTRWWWAVPAGLLGLVLAMVGGPVWGLLPAGLPDGLRRLVWLLAGVGGGLAILFGLGWGRVGVERLISLLGRGVVPVAPARWLSPHRSRSRWETVADEVSGQVVRRRVTVEVWRWPLPVTVLPVLPGRLLVLFTPPAGVEATRRVEVPAELARRVGPLIGDMDGRPVFLAQDHRFEGVMVSGKPGAGKSALIRDVVAFDSLDRVAPQHLPGCVGACNSLVIVDTKGGLGVDEMLSVLAGAGDSAVVSELADPSTPAIDLLAGPGTALERAAGFVDLMQDAMGAGAIQFQSRRTLMAVLHAALVATPGMLGEAGLPPDLSVLERAAVLLTDRGDEAARLLAGVLGSHLREGEVGLAVAGLTQLFGMDNPGGVRAVGERARLVDAPRSKISDLLLGCPAWWQTDRPRFSWDEAVKGHWAVVLGVGAARCGAEASQGTARILSAMLMAGLQRTMMRCCRGWQEAGRAVSLFCDEVGMLVGDGDGAAVVWWRNASREFGGRYGFGTQLLPLLPAGVRDALLSSGTLMWLTQTDEASQVLAGADLSAGGEVWSAADVANLPEHFGLLRTHAGGRRMPPVPVRVLWRPDGRDLVVCQRTGQV